MLKKFKDNKKKGFTLVELIVVLVILAILAALLIPALTGYIDKAKRKSIVAETRQTVMAAQTLVDEAYALDTKTAITITVGAADEDASTITTGDILKLAETQGTITTAPTVGADGKVTELAYNNGGKTCTYHSVADGSYTDGNYNVTAQQ